MTIWELPQWDSQKKYRVSVDPDCIGGYGEGEFAHLTVPLAIELLAQGPMASCS